MKARNGKTRVDLTGGGTPRTIVYDGQTTQSNAGSVSSSDNDLIESLADDRPESLLYGLRQPSFAMRFLGSRFRTDDGTNKNYAGPFYDAFQSQAAAAQRTDSALRSKVWYFDTLTGLFAKTGYSIQRNGAAVHVETVYSGWSKSAGQAVPGQIARRENGVDVITIAISAAQVSPTANDGLFSKP